MLIGDFSLDLASLLRGYCTGFLEKHIKEIMLQHLVGLHIFENVQIYTHEQRRGTRISRSAEGIRGI